MLHLVVCNGYLFGWMRGEKKERGWTWGERGEEERETGERKSERGREKRRGGEGRKDHTVIVAVVLEFLVVSSVKCSSTFTCKLGQVR